MTIYRELAGLGQDQVKPGVTLARLSHIPAISGLLERELADALEPRSAPLSVYRLRLDEGSVNQPRQHVHNLVTGHIFASTNRLDRFQCEATGEDREPRRSSALRAMQLLQTQSMAARNVCWRDGAVRLPDVGQLEPIVEAPPNRLHVECSHPGRTAHSQRQGNTIQPLAGRDSSRIRVR